MIVQLAPSYSALLPSRPVLRGMGAYGLGDGYSDASQALSMGGSLAGGTLGVLGIPAVGVLAPTTAALSATIVGIGVAAVVIALAIIKNSGCGQTCIIAANDANQVEPMLQANLEGYFSGPRTVASQQAALANFDQIWNLLASACSNPALGNAGKRCISDRQAGACVWKQTAAGAKSFPGVPAAGDCWNWFSGYRDPIANDTGVVAGSPTLNDVVSQATGVQSSIPLLGGISFTDLLIPAALLLVIWWVS